MSIHRTCSRNFVVNTFSTPKYYIVCLPSAQGLLVTCLKPNKSTQPSNAQDGGLDAHTCQKALAASGLDSLKGCSMKARPMRPSFVMNLLGSCITA